MRRKTEIAHFIEIRAIIKAFSLVVALVVVAVVVAVAVVLAFRAFFTCYKLPQHSLELGEVTKCRNLHAGKAKVLFFSFSSLFFSSSIFLLRQLAQHYKFRPAIKSQCRKAINLMGVGPRETIHWPFGSTSGCNLVIYYCAERKKRNEKKKQSERARCASRFCRQWVKGTARRFARKVHRQLSDIRTAITTYIYIYLYLYIYMNISCICLAFCCCSSRQVVCLFVCSAQCRQQQQIGRRDALIICIRSCHVLTACHRSHRRSR